jgi:glycosyltransferase involved in cell wall biosynthesis
MLIYDVPIEPLNERYSVEWAEWFPKEFEKAGHTVAQVRGDVNLTDNIENGSFLDCIGTHYWKFQQLQKIFYLLYAGDRPDVIFFHDLWFPGIESLAYVRDMMKLKFKIAGYLHAGTYDPADRLAQEGMASWGEHLENAWGKIFDYVFVGSRWHRDLLNHNRTFDYNKIYPIGYPIDANYYLKQATMCVRRENIVLFPHRLNKEKHPEYFDQLPGIISMMLKKDITEDWTFVKTKDICQTKSEYYELLGKAKVAVSYAEQETFGIAMAEAAIMGCIPITPNKLSYMDTMEWQWRFDGLVGNSADLVIKAMNMPNTPYNWPHWMHYTPTKIVEQILYVLDSQKFYNIRRPSPFVTL